MENESQEPRSDMSPQHTDKADQYAEQLLGRIMELEARLDETQEVDGGTEPITDMSPQHYDAPDVPFDLSILGIRFSGGNFEVQRRRVKIHSPDGTTSPADFIVGVAEWNAVTPETGTIYLNYDLDAETGAYSYIAGADSAVRLYETEVVMDGATLVSAKITRIYRPGDVDIEAVWLDYPLVEEE